MYKVDSMVDSIYRLDIYIFIFFFFFFFFFIFLVVGVLPPLHVGAKGELLTDRLCLVVCACRYMRMLFLYIGCAVLRFQSIGAEVCR